MNSLSERSAMIPTKLWGETLQGKLFIHIRKRLQSHIGRQWLFPGLMHFLAFLQRLLKPKGLILANVPDYQILLNGNDDVMTPSILVYGIHEPDETQIFKKEILPGMTVIDIGANVGYFSLLASRQVGEGGKVYAFEPAPNNYGVLIENIRINHALNIMPNPIAISNKNGPLNFYLDKANFGAHTLSRQNIQIQYDKSIQIESVTLDDFVLNQSIKVDFIKMDVQGAEGSVIEKAVNTLKHHPVKILMEFWPAGLRNYGTDPMELLKKLSRIFSLSIVGFPGLPPKDNLLASILKEAEAKDYVNLFCIKNDTAHE